MKYSNCRCICCNKELGEFTIETFGKCFKGEDKNRRRKLFCKEDCYITYIKQFEVEVYKNNPIYAVEYNGEIRYMPYWFSNYYFTNIEDCRSRIDNSKVIIVPKAFLGAVARGEMI